MSVSWDKDEILVIANPRAGRLGSKQSFDHARLPSHAHWVSTTHPGHAETIALDASNQRYRTVIAAGGDGTIHEILNGLLRNPSNQTRLGVLSLGTANDYAYSLRSQAHSMPPFSRFCDIGLVHWASNNGSSGTRFFSNVAGIGLPGRVAHFARQMKRIPARVRYTLALLRSMGPAFRPIVSHITPHNSAKAECEELLMLSAAIGIREGSYPLTPNAVIDDGLLDILRVSMLRRVDLIRYFPRILRGSIPKRDPRIAEFRSEEITITSESAIPFHLDGEMPNDPSAANATQLSVRVLKKHLAVELLD
ncbi:MAG: hypothetical protein FJ308_16615 [Planctomycetes bacterium]|nr:hypothetical protein [Planctomycetota bacterium]